DLSLSLLALETLIFGLAVAALLAVLVRTLTQQAIADQAAMRQLKEQISIRDTLTRELNHRVKNTLANVLSIITLTRRRSTDLDGFATSLDGRVRALSATHDLLTRTDWGATPLRDVITTEMGPLGDIHNGVLEVSGPDILLAPNDALSIGLAMHELATNAAKFGALSVDGGKVLVTWQLQSDDLAIVEWREEGGPAVPSDRKRGFGTELIEKIVAHELKHPVDLEFYPGGVRCVMRIPVRHRGDFEIRQRRFLP
ncbi:MAG: sensor histidine kinase, partial [Hyphomicrobiales bacterium]